MTSSHAVTHSLPFIFDTATRDAFTLQYRGDNIVLEALKGAIDNVIKDNEIWANALPFVQSSGTGKSRLIVELGNDFYVLFLNLREDDPHGAYCELPNVLCVFQSELP